MKLIAWACILSAFLIGESAKKKKVIFFGDSITEAGVRPGGYILQVAERAAKENKSNEFDFIGSGVSENKVYDLHLRLEEDVLSKNPDVVIIYIGVNDIWHKYSHRTGTDYDKFEKFYNALIAKIKTKKCKLILATPATVSEQTDLSSDMDKELDKYCALIRTLAEQHRLPLVDLRKAFLEYNLANNPENKESGILTTDRVHLNDKGNELVAAEMWRAIKGL